MVNSIFTFTIIGLMLAYFSMIIYQHREYIHHGFYSYLNSLDHSTLCSNTSFMSIHPYSDEIYEDSYEINHDSVVFITDGAIGVARESIFLLLQQGFYVLVGVKSEDEVRSFTYERQKGLEPLVFDITSPVSVAKIIYRIKELKRDYNRTLSGIIINNIYLMDDLSSSSKQFNQSQNICEYERGYKYDSDLFDKTHQRLIKGPYRLLQAITENILLDTHDHRRIVFLSKDDQNDEYHSCNLLSAMKNLFKVSTDELIRQMQRVSKSVTNVTVSSILSTTTSSNNHSQNSFSSTLSGKNRMKLVTASSFKNLMIMSDINVDGLGNSNSNRKKGSGDISIEARAILHSMISLHPRFYYHIESNHE